MPRVFEKRQLEDELVSTMEAATLVMRLDSDSESGSGEVENDCYGLLDRLALVYRAISDPRYLNRCTRCSAGPLPIEDAIPENSRRVFGSLQICFMREVRMINH